MSMSSDTLISMKKEPVLIVNREVPYGIMVTYGSCVRKQWPLEVHCIHLLDLTH